ncbi:MAG: MFS transporter [Actinoallomurus sp.]
MTEHAAVSQRWTALLFIALAQLMVVLDATVVNIALPSAQRALHISDGDRQWVITAYTLVFGGLLLFGGRIADLVGRKRTFLIGLVGFAGASALGGAAVNTGMLLGARALQGAFGALLAPSALSLLATMFSEPRERAKAFGIYGAISGGGSAVGLILGGVLTEYLNWRWALYVNVPIAVVAFLGAVASIHVPAGHRHRARLDIPGVVLVTAGLVSLVYGFTRAESEGWSDGSVIGLFVAAGVLLVAFVVVEALTRAPLLPLRVILDRNRGGAYLAVGLAVIAMFGLFLFLTYYMQVVKGYSPVRSGLAFLPFTAGIVTGSTQIAARLMHRVPARALMVPGLLVGAAGMVLFTQLTVDSSYREPVLPATVLLGVGMGAAFMPAMTLATSGIRPQDAGVASAMVNTSQQVGGSIGTALLNTIAAGATTGWLATHAGTDPTRAAVHGYVTAFWWATAIMLLAALIVAVLVRTDDRGTSATAEDVDEPAAPVLTH